MPSPGYYSVTKQLADGTTADLIFVDTVTLAPRAAESVVRLPRNVQEVKRAQYAWLEATLQASVGRRSGWRIVVGHYPVFSAGEHGDTPELVAELLPVLERYAVDAYICGHDHTMQHLQDAGSGLQLMVNGNGAKLGSLTNRTGASTIRAALVYYGFMAHELSKNRLTTRALDAEGREQYVFSQAPRGLAAVKQDAAAGQDPTAAAAGAARQRGYASATKGAPADVLLLTVVGGVLMLLGLMLAVWRARRRSGGASSAGGGRTRALRYHSVFGSAFGGSAAAASAATVGPSVWSDDDLGEEDDPEEQVVELSHMA